MNAKSPVFSSASAVVLAIAVMASVPVSAQDSPDGRVWVAQNSGGTGHIRISGTSLENTIMSFGDSSELRKYDPVTQTWNVLTSWTTHYANNDWTGDTPAIGVYGSTVYVGQNTNSTKLGYSTDGGVTWSDLTIAGSRRVDGIYAYENKAYILRQSGYTNLIENGAEKAISNNRPMGDVSFLTSGGSDIYGIGSQLWIANANENGGDSANSVRYSSTFGEGSGAWTSPVIATGGGGYGGLFALDENTIFKAGGSGTYGLSLDGGESFSLVNIGLDTGTTRDIYAESLDSIWVAANKGLFYFNGDEWLSLNDQLEGYDGQVLRGLYQVEGFLWVGGVDGSVWMAGAAIPEPSTIMFLSVAFAWGALVVLRRRKSAKN